MNKLVKCTKCGTEVSESESKKTSKGVLCKKCARKRTLAWVIPVVLVALAGAAAAIVLTTREKSIDGFENNTAINDSINVVVQDDSTLFQLGDAIAVAPSTASQTASDIESFKKLLEQSRAEAEEQNNGQIVIPSIYTLFDYRSSVVKDNALLKEYANAYSETNKEAKVLIEGYACNLGTDEVNNRISQERAENVKRILAENGIPEGNIEVKWYGKSRNAEFNYNSKEEYRRVVVSIK